MPDSVTPTDRKPESHAKEPANIVLNRFLEANGILIGTKPQEIEGTEKGSIIIHPPTIISYYAKEALHKAN
jgi:hypothetical protein